MNFFEQRHRNWFPPASTATDVDLAESDGLSVVEDAGLPLDEVFPTRLRKPPKPLIEQIPWPDARAEISKSVSLIKSIPDDLHPRIERMLIRVFRGQSTRDGLINWLVEKCGASEAKARLIADDQMAKISEGMLRNKWRRRGVKYVKWVHGTCSDPREYHRRDWDGRSASNPNALNGLVFPIDRPPVIDLRTGEHGYPGQLVGCTCHLEPVMPKRSKPKTASRCRPTIRKRG